MPTHEKIYLQALIDYPDLTKTSKHEVFVQDAISSNTSKCILWPFTCKIDTINYKTPVMRKSIQGKQLCMNPCRLSLILSQGYSDIKERNECAHDPILCNNSLCINPKHLRWATRQENHDDTKIAETNPEGVRNSQAVLTEGDVRAIRKDTRKLRETSEDYGVTGSMIHLIRTKQRWKHIK